MDLAKEAWRRRWWYGPRNWRFWRRQAWVEPAQFRLARQQRLTDIIAQNPQLAPRWRRWRREHQPAPQAHPQARVNSESQGFSTGVDVYRREMSPTPTPGPSLYDQFVAGEVMSDDEDAGRDWEDDEDAGSEGSFSPSDDVEVEELDNPEPALYQDLLVESSDSQTDLQPVLLAHLTSSTSTPLTRRRYAALLTSQPHTPTGLHDVIQDRRLVMQDRSRDDWDDERRRSCVVCTIEPRDTILWPCRCLALCNECRESLAARLPAAEHMCPCCRRKVEGYSRIYVP